ncbi:hypothetical protein IKG28_00160 [Candidatus Saccharibacteria bacterium]|nr:hypothetical protein [Candidatus Saccharibacteria bacterium]
MKVKYLFMILVSSFIGIMSSSEFLMADAAPVVFSDLDKSSIVETVIPEPEPEPVIEYTAPVYATYAAAPVYTPANHIEIAGQSIGVTDVASTAMDAGWGVNKYGKLLYGHSNAAFGGIVNYGVGGTFTMTYGGVTRTYQVMDVKIYDVVFDANGAAVTIKPAGAPAGNLMTRVANATSSGITYDLALMTCTGVPMNGTMSQRFVLFANAI